MRSPEDQQEFLEHRRFGEGRLSFRYTKWAHWLRILAYIVAALFTAVLVLVAFIDLRGRIWHTAVKGRQELGMCEYGYEVETRGWHDQLRVQFYTCLSRLDYQFSSTSLLRVQEARWLGDRRAILLELDLHQDHDSLGQNKPAKILYDFQTGQLAVVSDLELGSYMFGSWKSHPRMSEEELQRLVQQLGP